MNCRESIGEVQADFKYTKKLLLIETNSKEKRNDVKLCELLFYIDIFVFTSVNPSRVSSYFLSPPSTKWFIKNWVRLVANTKENSLTKTNNALEDKLSENRTIIRK